MWPQTRSGGRLHGVLESVLRLPEVYETYADFELCGRSLMIADDERR